MSQTGEHKRGSAISRLGELFDASALGLVTLLLLGASLFMTWRGMSDFIASRDFAEGAVSEGLIFVIVATLSLAMYVALREMVAPYFVRGWWSAIWKRVVAGILYSVLAMWSVGFGYGFWWSLVAGQDATEAALAQSVTSVRAETSDMRARLAAAGSVMASAEALSNNKAEEEAARGGTCGINSPAGPGPLSRARRETQAQIAALSASVRQEWQLPLVARLAELEGGLQAALDDKTDLDGAARKSKFEILGRQTQAAAQELGADATARGRTIAAQLRAKASQLAVPPINGRVSYCYDPDLSASLRSAANELEQVYEIKVTPFRYAEGADGVARAIEDLAGRAGHLVGLGENDAQAAPTGRDLIALLAALGVDLALFIFGLLRGSGGRRERRSVAADPVVIIEQAPPEPSEQIIQEAAQALPSPKAAKMNRGPRIRRIEADPSAVGIGSSAAGSRSQLAETEQVDDLIEGVDGIYRRHSKDALLAQKDDEIKRLQAELDRLKAMGYIATGRPGQVFDAALHKAVERQVSEQAEGMIIATVRPGFLLSSGGLHRIAEVIVSRGPNPYKYDD